LREVLGVLIAFAELRAHEFVDRLPVQRGETLERFDSRWAAGGGRGEQGQLRRRESVPDAAQGSVRVHAYPTTMTPIWPGPWTPRTRICSISAVRLGPVIRTMELLRPAGLGISVYSSSRPVRMRWLGTIARCIMGSREMSRASSKLEIMTRLPV